MQKKKKTPSDFVFPLLSEFVHSYSACGSWRKGYPGAISRVIDTEFCVARLLIVQLLNQSKLVFQFHLIVGNSLNSFVVHAYNIVWCLFQNFGNSKSEFIFYWDIIVLQNIGRRNSWLFFCFCFILH